MKCPTCSDERLVMTERSGIEIDYCPTCRGVWLDRGELDKIIERSSSVAGAAPSPTPAGQDRVPSAPLRRDGRVDRTSVQRSRDDDRYDRYDFDGDRHGSDVFGDHRYDDRHDDRDGDKRRSKKRRESLLSELFDF
jgi:Zn-finger nucleic acid-binding protein